MAQNRGKQFEAKLKEDFKKSFPSGLIERIYDQMSGYKTITNISDFFAYNYPNLFLLEAKTHKGNTFPLINLTQYDKLKEYVGTPGIRVGVIIWFQDHDKVIYIPIASVTKMKLNKKKSINIKTLYDENYRFIEIPSVKKRVFMDSDYSVLATLQDKD